MALFGRKSMRQFSCNDALWATFERMAGDQEKSVDELVNDALESYAQLAGYQTGIDAESDSDAGYDGPSTPPPMPTRRLAKVVATGNIDVLAGDLGGRFQRPGPSTITTVRRRGQPRPNVPLVAA